jgi:hypothetical protein
VGLAVTEGVEDCEAVAIGDDVGVVVALSSPPHEASARQSNSALRNGFTMKEYQ